MKRLAISSVLLAAGTLFSLALVACGSEAGDPATRGQPIVNSTRDREASIRSPVEYDGGQERVVIVSKPLPPPRTMLELVHGMEIIGVGTVGPLVKETMESDTLPFDTLGTPVPPHLTPYLYYEVSFEQVFRDDGTVASGKPVLVRFAGTLDERNVRVAEDNYAHVRPGARGLIFLSEFKGSYQIARTGYGLLDIVGNEVRYSSNGQTAKVVDFTTNTTPDAFLAELKDIITKDALGK